MQLILQWLFMKEKQMKTMYSLNNIEALQDCIYIILKTTTGTKVRR